MSITRRTLPTAPQRRRYSSCPSVEKLDDLVKTRIAYIRSAALLCMWDGFVVYVINEREICLNNNTGAKGMSFFIFPNLHSLLGEAAFTNTHATCVHVSQSWRNWIEQLRCPSNKLTMHCASQKEERGFTLSYGMTDEFAHLCMWEMD